jgi:hypothetical protein
MVSRLLQGAGLFAQLVFTARREHEHRQPGTGGAGHGLGCLLDDDTGVGTAGTRASFSACWISSVSERIKATLSFRLKTTALSGGIGGASLFKEPKFAPNYAPMSHGIHWI